MKSNGAGQKKSIKDGLPHATIKSGIINAIQEREVMKIAIIEKELFFLINKKKKYCAKDWAAESKNKGK